ALWALRDVELYVSSSGRAMSALGQKQTFAAQKAMSALPPIATSIAFFGMSALGHKRTSSRSLDHLIGASKQSCWHIKTEGLGGLEIDHQFVLGRHLHREVARLFALEDAIDVAGRPTELVDRIRPVGDQATLGDGEAIGVDRGQLIPGRKRNNQIAMN